MVQFKAILGKAKELEFSNDEDNELDICTKLSRLCFWCGDNTKHKQNPNYHLDYCCFTHVVGLPKHAATGQEMALTPYQVEFTDAIIEATTNPGNMSNDDWLRLHHFFHILKGRQMGFTEIVLRIMQFFCFNRYVGKKVGIMAATSKSLSLGNLRRFYQLFENIPETITGPVKNYRLQIINDTLVEAYAATEEAITGNTKYAALLMDESAKWNLIDDTSVFNSIMPVMRQNGSDLFLVSTFKGPIKMFYKIYKDPQEFIKLEYDIWRTEGNLNTKATIENMLATSKEDPDQEYLCKATIGRDSILGIIEDNDRVNYTEWDAMNDEDDNFVEDDF